MKPPAADLPQADQVGDAPHPRATARLYGQQAAEAAFLAAFNADRLHHGWLLTGPRGIGKATLAWRIARFLLAQDPPGQAAAAGGGLFGDARVAPASLDVPDDHPTARRVAALAEPRLFLLRRSWDHDARRLKTVITVDETRKLHGFFGLTAADGGRRVVIVDAADEMNPSAANALLKLLEEPPKGAVLLVISHQPARLLPTIRSRCRSLRLAPLGAGDMAHALAGAGAAPGEDAQALAVLSGGSVGQALRLAALDGPALYARLVALVSGLPRLDRAQAHGLAELAAARDEPQRFDLLVGLVDTLLARLARSGPDGPTGPEAAPGEAAVLARLSPDLHAARIWAGLQQSLGARARAGRAVNLDPAALVLDMVLKIEASAAGLRMADAGQERRNG